MKILSLTALVLLLSGCASTKQTYGPDGRVAHSLNCSGTLRDWGMCYQKAGEICGLSGYDVLTMNGERGLYVSGTGGIYGTTTHYRTMTISCKT